jgi:hypothetical protein
MCSEGLFIEDKQGAGEEFKQKAKILYEQGPQLWNEDEINKAKYQITDFLSDFRSTEDFEESLFILNKLIELLAGLVLRGDGNWVGAGKWFPRNLKSYDKDLCEKLVNLNYSQIF